MAPIGMRRESGGTGTAGHSMLAESSRCHLRGRALEFMHHSDERLGHKNHHRLSNKCGWGRYSIATSRLWQVAQ